MTNINREKKIDFFLWLEQAASKLLSLETGSASGQVEDVGLRIRLGEEIVAQVSARDHRK